MEKVGIIPGDGVGPQLAAQAVKVLQYFQQTAGLNVEILPLEACGVCTKRCARPARISSAPKSCPVMTAAV